jgi:ribonuclease P protein component
MQTRYTFKKEEKLKSRKLIEILFKEGKRIKSFPIQIVYLQIDHLQDYFVQAGFSVPKKQFKRAVDRNKLKRLMREAYRLQKNQLPDIIKNKEKKYIIMFIYMSDKITPYKKIESTIDKLLKELNQKINI